MEAPVLPVLAALPVAAAFGAVAIAGGDPLPPLRAGQADGLTYTQGNLYYLFTAFGPEVASVLWLFDRLLLAALVALAVHVFHKPLADADRLIDLCLFVLVRSIFARMSWYEILCLPALAILLLRRRDDLAAVALLAGGSMAVALLPNLWWHLLRMEGLEVLAGTAPPSAGPVAFLLLQIAYLAAKAALVLLLLRLRARPRLALPEQAGTGGGADARTAGWPARP